MRQAAPSRKPARPRLLQPQPQELASRYRRKNGIETPPRSRWQHPALTSDIPLLRAAAERARQLGEANGWSSSTTRCAIDGLAVAVRSLFRFAKKHGRIFANPARRLSAAEPEPSLLPMTDDEIRAVEQAITLIRVVGSAIRQTRCLVAAGR